MSFTNQYFLLIEKIKSCRYRVFGDLTEGDINSGQVVIRKPCNDANEFEVHRGSETIDGPLLVNREGGLPPNKVAAITDQDFDILLGTHPFEDKVRLDLHSSGRLKWASLLKDSDAVRVKLDRKSASIAGVIKAIGTRPLPNYHGLLFIVEITDEAFKDHFGDKPEKRKRFLSTKNCGIIVSADQLYPPYPPEQPKSFTATEAKNETYQAEVGAVDVKIKQSRSMTQLSTLKERAQQFSQMCEELEKTIQELEDQESDLRNENKSLNEQVQHLEGELQEKVALIDQQKEELCVNEIKIEKLHGELREKLEEIDTNREESEQRLKDQQLQHEEQLREQQLQHEQQLRDQQEQHEQALADLRQQNERSLRELQGHHQREENRLQQEQEQLQLQVAQFQEELQMMTDQKQQLQARVETAFAYMRGDPGTSQVGFDAIELWEVPREDVHVSNKILGTGGWGYVAEGVFRGQKVAVKCLHRGILSQFTSNHVRREISIMAQVRHPNLVLLIGAVLNADTGPLIITELLDRSLRSAYEEHLLEEHCKLPILRDVAAALTYLHSHRRPIIHRDVSSANVLLEAVRNNSWRAKLSDFGSANLIRLATTPAEGAAPYAAPEVRTEARNQQTPKVDVFSFGVLLCEISLCRFPPDPSEFATFLASARDNVDPRLYELARNCTKRDPEQRPSIREVLTQIEELILLVVA